MKIIKDAPTLFPRTNDGHVKGEPFVLHSHDIRKDKVVHQDEPADIFYIK